MKVYEEQFQLKLPRDPHRSVGVHLSQILRHHALMIGVLDKKFDVPLDDNNCNMALLGMAWEDHLAKHQLPGVQYHPGELVLDGIAMSPDGISAVDDPEYAGLLKVNVDSWILEEFKLTAKSSRGFKEALLYKSDKVKLWLWQIMGYRYALNMLNFSDIHQYHLLSNVARLHVMFIKGNYSKDMDDPESKPQQKVYRLHFSDEELVDNWQMITTHRDYMAEIGELKNHD